MYYKRILELKKNLFNYEPLVSLLKKKIRAIGTVMQIKFITYHFCISFPTVICDRNTCFEITKARPIVHNHNFIYLNIFNNLTEGSWSLTKPSLHKKIPMSTGKILRHFHSLSNTKRKKVS